MRLLYLRLPDYGPLRDTALAFPRVDVLERRHYALHFVVGVNGTGKSSALRALFRIFDCLSGGEWPDFNFDLAYQLHADPDQDRANLVLISRWGTARTERCIVFRDVPELPSGSASWRAVFSQLTQSPAEHRSDVELDDSNLPEFLPAGVLAYTSGLLAPWHNLGRPALDRLDLDALRTTEPDPTERPAAWSAREELQFSAAKLGADELIPALPTLDEWRALLRKPSAADPRWRTRVLDPLDTRLTGLAVALKQAVHDLAPLADEIRHEAQRREWQRQREEAARSQGDVSHDLRWLLTAAGLAWPTHIAFTLDRRARDIWIGDTSERLLLLYALAENVAPLPLGRERVVISLHHRDTANIAAQLRRSLGEAEAEALVSGNPALGDLLAAIGTPTYGAQALLRLLGGKEANALDAFRTLAFWRDQGLLVEATATFRRIDRDSVVTYDDLSDGEQQLLQRGGLLLLLQGADDHLLLLDEPETHFNDRWKRELIDVVDDNLRKTRSHVILTTHSSIVLSDAFRDEIIILTPEGVFQPSMPTFGADPSRILQHVFQSPDAIGQRAREALAAWLTEFGDRVSSDQRTQLATILTEVGGGPERIRLRETLARSDAQQDP